jgi:hypothetical protein
MGQAGEKVDITGPDCRLKGYELDPNFKPSVPKDEDTI